MNASNIPAASPTPALSTAEPSLDQEAVRRLRELDPEGKHGVVGRVMLTFESSLQRALQQLEDARAAGDVAAVGSLAHMLKSSSASVGALGLSACCQTTERAIRAGENIDLDRHVACLVDEAGQALVAVRAMLRGEGPTSR